MDIKIRNLEYLRKWLILGILIGIAAGFGAIIFYYMIAYAQDLFLGHMVGMSLPSSTSEGSQPYVPGNYLLVPVSIMLGGLFSGLLVYTFAPEAEGHGTDAMIESFHHKDGKIRRRVPLVKAIASAITIGSGGSAGREGPTAQIAAGIGSFLADTFRLSPSERRIAVLVGTGAGIGTIFKAPIGGALLAIEVPYKRDFETNALFPAIVASAIGYSIFGSIVGFQPIFGYYLGVFNPLSLPFFAILGVAAGIFVIFYVKVFYEVQGLFRSLRIKNHYKPMIGALVVGVIALIFPEVMGVGYGWVQMLFNNSVQSLPTFGLPLLLVLIVLPFAKVFATSFSIGSGGSGGVFAPGIFIGASLGLIFGMLFNYISPSIAASVTPFVIVGALAFMGGAGKIPISVLLMVTEMTGSLQLLPAAMIAVALSYLISGQNTIYSSQVPTRTDSPAHAHEFDRPILENIKIKDLGTVDIALTSEHSVSYARKRMHSMGLTNLPVVDSKGGKVLGKVSMLNLHGGYLRKLGTAPMDHIEAVRPQDSARRAMTIMAKCRTTWVPVVQKGKYMGCVTLGSVGDRYNKLFGDIFRKSSSSRK